MRTFLKLVGLALLFGLAGLSVAMLTRPANANPQCAPLAQVIGGLATGYDETMRGRGVAGNGSEMLFFRDPEGDTWTILVLMPDGTACLVASGTGWTDAALTPAPAGMEI